MSDIYCLKKLGNDVHHGWFKEEHSYTDRTTISFHCEICTSKHHVGWKEDVVQISKGDKVECKTNPSLAAPASCYGVIENPQLACNLGHVIYIKCENQGCPSIHHSRTYKKFLENWNIHKPSSFSYEELFEKYGASIDDVRPKGPRIEKVSLSGGGTGWRVQGESTDENPCANLTLESHHTGKITSFKPRGSTSVLGSTGGIHPGDAFFSTTSNQFHIWGSEQQHKESNMHLKIDRDGAKNRVLEVLSEALGDAEGVTLVSGNKHNDIYGWLDDDELEGSPVGFRVYCVVDASTEEHLKGLMAEKKARQELRDEVASLSDNNKETS